MFSDLQLEPLYLSLDFYYSCNKSVPSFYPVGAGNLTQVVKHSSLPRF